MGIVLPPGTLWYCFQGGEEGEWGIIRGEETHTWTLNVYASTMLHDNPNQARRESGAYIMCI